VKKATLKQIAEKLDISVSTVSRALSNKEGVGNSLKKEIIREAKKIGYVFKIDEKNENSANIFGVIVPNIQNPFFLNFLKGIESVLFHRNYRFIMCNTDEDVNKEKIYLKWLQENKVLGIIAAPAFARDGSNNLSIYREIRKNIPIVLYDREFHECDEFDSVCTDNKTAICEAVEYLYKMGHRKIGILLSKRGNFCIEERLNGFLLTTKKLRMEVDENWIVDDLYPSFDITGKFDKFFSSTEKPTAVISTTHSISCNFLKNIRNKGLDVPKDISLIGYTDVIESDIFDPPLTTIKQPILEIGHIAATTTLARIDDQYYEPSKVVLKTQLVERNSVKKINI